MLIQFNSSVNFYGMFGGRELKFIGPCHTNHTHIVSADNEIMSCHRCFGDPHLLMDLLDDLLQVYVTRM